MITKVTIRGRDEHGNPRRCQSPLEPPDRPVEAGNEVVITRRGKPVARITPVGALRKPLQSLAVFRARMPDGEKSSSELVRDLRDDGY